MRAVAPRYIDIVLMADSIFANSSSFMRPSTQSDGSIFKSKSRG